MVYFILNLISKNCVLFLFLLVWNRSTWRKLLNKKHLCINIHTFLYIHSYTYITTHTFLYIHSYTYIPIHTFLYIHVVNDLLHKRLSDLYLFRYNSSAINVKTEKALNLLMGTILSLFIKTWIGYSLTVNSTESLFQLIYFR